MTKMYDQTMYRGSIPGFSILQYRKFVMNRKSVSSSKRQCTADLTVGSIHTHTHTHTYTHTYTQDYVRVCARVYS